MQKKTLVLYEEKAWPEIKRWLEKKTDVSEYEIGCHIVDKDEEKIVILSTVKFRNLLQKHFVDKLLLFGRFYEEDLIEIEAKIIYKD